MGGGHIPLLCIFLASTPVALSLAAGGGGSVRAAAFSAPLSVIGASRAPPVGLLSDGERTDDFRITTHKREYCDNTSARSVCRGGKASGCKEGSDSQHTGQVISSLAFDAPPKNYPSAPTSTSTIPASAQCKRGYGPSRLRRVGYGDGDRGLVLIGRRMEDSMLSSLSAACVFTH